MRFEPPNHHVTEDYAHYQHRKKKEFNNKANFGIFLIIAMIIFIGIFSFINRDTNNTNNKEERFYCGMDVEEFIKVWRTIEKPEEIREPTRENGGNTLFYLYWEDDVGYRIDFLSKEGLSAIWKSSMEGIKKQAGNKERIFGCGWIDGKFIRVV